MLRDQWPRDFEQILVVDVRSGHEFSGGRICGARSITTVVGMVKSYKEYRGKNVCVIFHCEPSMTRGPAWMRAFRNYERLQNRGQVPDVMFPAYCSSRAVISAGAPRSLRQIRPHVR